MTESNGIRREDATASQAIEGRSVVVAVVEVLAAATGRDPIDLDPLYDTIDPEALNAIFAPRAPGQVRIGTVSFPVGDWDVTVVAEDEGGRVELRPRGEPDEYGYPPSSNDRTVS